MDKEIEDKIINGIKEYFGSSLISIVLFGSQAQGTATEHSDIDLVVIAKGIPSDWRKQDEIIRNTRWSSGLSALPISIILKSPTAVKSSLNLIQPLLFGILKSYKVLYDPTNFFETQAEIYRKNMKKWRVEEIADHTWRVGVIADDAKRRLNAISNS
ncbi:TPA: nucleotidyltransferase domain-containing protein [bacterium]|nr:nucleotidyltransferase domain-containing protein [bacterium]